MTSSSTLDLIPGTTKIHLLRLLTVDYEMQGGIIIILNIILIVITKDGLTSKGEILKTTIVLVVARTVAKIITLDLNADTTTELYAIDVMSMDIRRDSVPMMHSNQ